ncbi:peptidase [Stutzerimonas xanthomarina]|uniref:PepSY-associated TM helix domain-containing protein n=1 Tax=Stutzerimonas nitrititolerans TaxID=2482751 RepID=UPI0008240A49|nr:PepSY domain-containing protein [Stutzerimonas nitrititolerans]OCX20141.1 peptidase [Stutzerimonas xanthomarina]HBB80034.1 PepSY domain-containing protein [Pseudomonas sp.]
MSKKSRSRLWFLVHSWLALPIWFFLLIICVTGTLATVSQEIVWLANPDVRASKPSTDAERLDYEHILQAVQTQEPRLAVLGLSRPQEDHFALTVRVAYPDATTATLYVNPYSGAIQGVSPLFDFRQFTRALHGWWLAPWTDGYSWGWYLVCSLGPLMLASLITGLVVYKRFWRAFFKPRLRLNQGARVFWGDFHRLSGIWSIWFIAIISVTGTWFLLQAILSDFDIPYVQSRPPAVIQRDAVTTTAGQAPPTLGLDEITRIAQARVPGFEPSFIRLPESTYGPVTIGGRGWYPLMNQSLSISPYDGSIVGTNLLDDRPALSFVTESMYPLHFGDFGGLWLKLVWFLFGLLLTFMVLSGLLIWSKRTVKATAQQLRRPPRAARGTSLETAVENTP